MATLETTFAGLKLRNPIIVSSSGLTDSAAKNQKLSEAGAGAIAVSYTHLTYFICKSLGVSDA